MELVKAALPPGFKIPPSGEDTEEYYINMGPQHPATHGVLRLVLRLDGENVIEAAPHLGYIHRGIEKQAENETYVQYIHLTDRMDYITSHMNNLAVCLAIEKGMGMGVPERGEYIRVMVNELQRIQSHLLFFGCFGGDLGAVSSFLYGFRERELITDLFEELCGARLTMNYFRPGGVAFDLPPGFSDKVRHIIGRVKLSLGEFDRLFTDNLIVQSRTVGIGVLSADKAVQYGCTGQTLRAAGVPYDLRVDDPYSIYDQFDFDVPVGNNGDCFDRYLVRLEEVRQSIRILEQCIDRIPDGPYRSKEKLIRLPAGNYYAAVETAKGIFGTYIVAEKGEKPYRIHSRSPNMANLSALNEMIRGHKIADIIPIIATLDIVIPDIDR